MTGHRDTAGIFHEPIDVAFRDTDRDGHIRLSTWLAWLAGLAGDDYEARGLSRDELIRRGQVFLINRFAFKVRRMPRCYEHMNAMTWEHGTEAIYFNRHYAFEAENGERIADARSAWLLCDPVRHRILRPRALEGEVGNISRAIDCPELTQLSAPDDLETLGQRKIMYTDLDANHHVYCANYGNIIDDFLPASLVSLPLRTFEINYIKEAVLGEALDIKGKATAEGYVLAGYHKDGNISFISRINVENSSR